MSVINTYKINAVLVQVRCWCSASGTDPGIWSSGCHGDIVYLVSGVLEMLYLFVSILYDIDYTQIVLVLLITDLVAQ